MSISLGHKNTKGIKTMNQKVIKPGIVRRMVERIESSGHSISPEIADMCVIAFLDNAVNILMERSYRTKCVDELIKNKGLLFSSPTNLNQMFF